MNPVKTASFKLKISTFLIVSSLLFSGCQLLLDEAVDCIAKVKPKLPTKDLATGKIDVEYFDSITASAINAPDDDIYSYYFDFTGRPPHGINYIIDHRRIYFSGFPTEKGVFSFSITLSIGEGIIIPADGICFSDDSTTKKYTIVIN